MSKQRWIIVQFLVEKLRTVHALPLHFFYVFECTLQSKHTQGYTRSGMQICCTRLQIGQISLMRFGSVHFSISLCTILIYHYSKLRTPNGESRRKPALMHLIAIFSTHLRVTGSKQSAAAGLSSACSYFRVINSPFYNLVTAEMPHRAAGYLVSMKTLSSSTLLKCPLARH